MVTLSERVATEIEALCGRGDALVKALGDGPIDQFRSDYQSWYSVALSTVRTLAADRVVEFEKLYQRTDKSVNQVTYGIQDYLLNIEPSYSDPRSWTVHRVRQQVAILRSIAVRLDNAIADLRGVIEAGLLANEASAARELLRAGHLRAAGCLTGVVIERQLASLARSRGATMKKADPSIGDWNDLLKQNDVFDIATWRRVQRFSDIRNLCCHARGREPTPEEVEDLIGGAEWLGTDWSA
jgi:hypothetical protein